MELIFPRLISETRPPLNTDDTTKGYIVGQPWIDTSGLKYYICMSNVEENAIWEQCVTPSTVVTCCESINNRLKNIEELLTEVLDEISDGTKADFEGTPVTGSTPLSVSFTDKSIGNITAWKWNFGDGTTSNLQNPTHTYSALGIYDVYLTVTTDTNITDLCTKKSYITVSESFTANFTSDITNGVVPLTVQFTDTSSSTATTWHWEFGDGSSSDVKNPSHTYTSAGTYVVSLNITNGGSLSDNETKVGYIIVTPAGVIPVANFTATPTSGIQPLMVSFTNTSTGSISNYSWDFGDGTTGTVANPIKSYATPGTYTVTLIVNGPSGSNSITKTNFITVTAATIPVANFTATPTSGTSPLTVAFTNTSTGTISSYAWSFGDGSASSAQNPSHTYTSNGNYTVVLTVTGPTGADTETKTNFITVGESNTINADFTTSITSGMAPLSVAFTNTSSSSGSITSYSWNFGDGSTSSLASPTHNYTTAGTYSVTLTITDSNGLTDTETKLSLITVNTSSTIPVANFTATPTSGSYPLTVAFTNTSTGTISSYAWTFGDGITSTSQNPSHTYTTSGTYSVSLTVTGVGGTNTKTVATCVVVSSTSDPQVINPSLKSFDTTITGWTSGTWTTPTGWTAIKAYSDTALQITHNFGVNPSNYIIQNTDNNVFVPKSDVRTLINESVNTSTFTQCQVSDTFICRLLFPSNYGGTQGSSVTLYRISISNWINGTWAIPSGWSASKYSSTCISLTHNLGKYPVLWESMSYTPNAINNLVMTDTNNIRITFPSSITTSAFDIDVYFTN